MPTPALPEEFYDYGGKAVCSNHVIKIKIADNEADLDLEGKSFFHPKYTHQIFNPDETLRGHEEPKINIFLTPTTLKPYLTWSTKCRSTESKSS
jgi:hypothetical protein